MFLDICHLIVQKEGKRNNRCDNEEGFANICKIRISTLQVIGDFWQNIYYLLNVLSSCNKGAFKNVDKVFDLFFLMLFYLFYANIIYLGFNNYLWTPDFLEQYQL